MNQQDFDQLFPVNALGEDQNPKFLAWMKAVDDYLVKRTGLSSSDLPDYCYHDDFDDGATPRQAAVAAIHAAKEF